MGSLNKILSPQTENRNQSRFVTDLKIRSTVAGFTRRLRGTRKYFGSLTSSLAVTSGDPGGDVDETLSAH